MSGEARDIHLAEQSVASSRNFGAMVAAFMAEVSPRCPSDQAVVEITCEYIRSYWYLVANLQRRDREQEP